MINFLLNKNNIILLKNYFGFIFIFKILILICFFIGFIIKQIKILFFFKSNKSNEDDDKYIQIFTNLLNIISNKIIFEYQIKQINKLKNKDINYQKKYNNFKTDLNKIIKKNNKFKLLYKKIIFKLRKKGINKKILTNTLFKLIKINYETK